MTASKRTSWLWDRHKDLRRLKIAVGLGLLLLSLEWVLVQTGAVHEAYARMDPTQVIPAQAAKGTWVELPASAFVDIGWEKDGFSGERMIQAWQAAGLNARQAALVSQQMQDHFSPVVMGVDDPALARQVQERAQLVADYWKLRWPQAHAKLERMQRDGWHPSEPLDTQSLGLWRLPYEQLTQPRSQLPRLQEFHFGGASMAQARQQLADAVARSGLRGLRLWYTDMATPLQLEATISGLDAAEREMQGITGWQPGVLGLYGRVFLTLRKPADAQTEGSTHDHDEGQLTIECNWDTLSHEWFHALDLHLQREAFTTPGRNALTSNLGVLRQARQPRLVDAWGQAREEIIDAQAAWKWRRWKHALRHMDFYWVSDAETMAYAFAEHAMLHHPQALDSSQVTGLPGMRPLVPSQREAQGQSAAWKRLLERVRPWVEPARS